MIDYIQVTGFKSLNSFELHLHPGLNILVGPNGSGKTNIITFFQFLDRLLNENVSDAISNSGGAGTIFHKQGHSEYSTTIDAVIGGSYKRRKKIIYYEYSFSIGLQESGLFAYNVQRLKIKSSSSLSDLRHL